MCERRIKVFVKIKKKKKNLGGGGGRGGQVGGSGWWGGWVRVDVNPMLGVGGDVGYGGCEPRVEGIVQYKENKKKMWGGGGRGNI